MSIKEVHFLKSIFSPTDFTESELTTIIAKFKQVHYSKGDFFLQAGKVEQYYWFLESGFCRSFVINSQAKDITTDFFSVGDIVIDWSSFFLRHPTRENIQALTDCVCWELDYDTFQVLFHSIETFREHGRRRLVTTYFALKNHNVAIIADQAKERYLHLLKERPHIIKNVSQQYIATYLGITKYSLSRIRKEITL